MAPLTTYRTPTALPSIPTARLSKPPGPGGEMRSGRPNGLAPDDGPFTVQKVIEGYFADRAHRGSKGVAKDRHVAKLRIIPILGALDVAKLTTKQIRDWHNGLATAPKLARRGLYAADRKIRKLDTTDQNAVRARRATANRTLTVLKAALNHAFREGHIAADEAWRKVKPFREVDD